MLNFVIQSFALFINSFKLSTKYIFEKNILPNLFGYDNKVGNRPQFINNKYTKHTEIKLFAMMDLLHAK